MPSSVDLGKRLEATVKNLVTKGRYNSRSEVLREGIRLVDEREKRLEKLNAALDKGIADAEAGRLHTAEEVFTQVRRRIRQVAVQQAKKRA
ncbi:MAG TPA: type II toxin-antitoxin system ParD family antitoxin [Rhizomicrobium sp.]|nr:type II toxin-antitoxin system ParD family antitoxin [Rhizomicrobium sp.]